MVIVEFSLILRFLKSTFKNIFPIFQLSLSEIHFMIMAKIMAVTFFFPIAVLIIIITVDEARGKNKEPALIWA